MRRRMKDRVKTMDKDKEEEEEKDLRNKVTMST